MFITTLILSGMLASQAPPPGAPPVSTTPDASTLPALAVLPVLSRIPGDAGTEAAAFLTAGLSRKLADLGAFKVISADEVAELVKNEADRQGVGCTDDGCLAELAGALGARFIVTGDVAQVGRVYTWSASLVDQQTSAVTRRAQVKGAAFPALVSQVEDVALALSGRADEAKLEGPAAMRRYGFRNEADLADFRAYREKQPERSTGEALTRFLVDRNRESDRLAVAEAVLLGTAAVMYVLTMVTAPAMAFATSASFSPVLGVAGMVLVGGMLAVTGGTFLSAVGLLAVDAMNRGRVKVDAGGCCRDDTAVDEGLVDGNVHRAAAAGVTLLAAFVPLILLVGLVGIGQLSPLLVFLITIAPRADAWPTADPANLPLYLASIFIPIALFVGSILGLWGVTMAMFLLSPVPAVATGIVGLLLLFKPNGEVLVPAREGGEP